MVINKIIKRERKKKAIRNKIRGTAEIPRLTVFKSCKNVFAQLIDDDKRITLCSSSTQEKSLKKKSNVGMCNIENAKIIGKLLAQRAKKKSISKVVFDRNGFKYHGRIKALADSCREEGLIF